MSLVKYNLNGNKVEYDNTEFEILTNYYKEKYLHYIGNGKNITNPRGNTSCYAMFRNYKGTNLDLSNFTTSNIVNMYCIFSYCDNLEIVDLSNFNTEKVKNMRGMFSYCNKLKQVNLSNINIHNTKYLNEMFANCKSLKELDISDFYFTVNKKVNNMFRNCKDLEKIKINSDSLQFFLDNKNLLFNNCKNVNIIPVTQTDKTINSLFY